MEKAEAESRQVTDEEKAAVDRLLGEARDLKGQIDRKKNDSAMMDEINKLTAGLSTSTPAVPSNGGTAPTAQDRSRLTLGQQFVASEAFDFFKRGGHRTSSAWRSPGVELQATTLTTDGASGGDLISPDVRPGILPLLFRQLTVADLIAPGTTESNLISYMKETTFTNAADTVAEGGTKPESALVFDAVSDAVRKIAHWLPVTEEMLEDAAQIRSYIDSRLRLGVQLVEEDQLLQGSGTPPDILGIRNRTGVQTAQARDTDTNADAIFKQLTNIAINALVQPDGIVMNPTNWSSIELLKDDAGNYMAGGPFASRISRTLWGLPVVVTPAIAAGTATVGAFRSAAQVFRKGGLRVEASNSHSDFFIKNLVAIRAEERLALAVYRPAAFGDVTGLD
jgi:HK97 family phage major capsid protein